MGFDRYTLILGAVQGLTEFLPISSSGHLALLQMFFDFRSSGLLAFDLILHCATTLAVLIFFRNDVVRLLTQWLRGFTGSEARASEGWTTGWAILAGTVATGVLALPLKGLVETAMRSYIAVGAGLLTTAGLLCIVPLLPKRNRALSIRVAVLVGIAQGLAVFPGVSRSGTTIMAALALGLAAPDAFRLSFLMSIPAIMGASLMEYLKVLRTSVVLPDGWLLSAAVAFLLGCLSLALLRRLVLSGKWAYFGIYCFLLGVFAIMSEIVTAF
ncbi:MAG: undecaprenyl-diphosphate phosphatase [Synergistaceae bacterium]|jgi:undecaprenyl-diphosphatase|nr:undecaprenyl-diphosphate phosphatase [Synergistaceae bacterium]